MGRPRTKLREFVDPSDLLVRHSGNSAPRQYSIENAPGILEDFDSQYVNISGFFGVHEPSTFAAAPLLLAQLRFAVKLMSGFPALNASAQLDAMREAIAKAEGLLP